MPTPVTFIPWRYQDCPGGASFAKTYADAWREGRRITAMGQKAKIFRDGPALDAVQFRAEMRRALEERIALKVAPAPVGRKHDPDYQRGLLQDANDLRAIHRRVRLYQLRTPELARRFGHLLANRND